jgi:hypothetical protein
VIVEGAELNLRLRQQERDLAAEHDAAIERNTGAPAQGDVVEETTVTHEQYVDPYYVSPLWLGLWLL